jgi:hypothetical protein
MTQTLSISKILGSLFGLLTLTLGVMNMARGNDFEFGVLLVMVALVFFVPVTEFVKRKLGVTVPIWFKIVLALLIVWVNLAVGAINEGYYPELLNRL